MADLFLSVANGSVKGLEQYLFKGGNPNLKDTTKTTLLHKVSASTNVFVLIILKSCYIHVFVYTCTGI